MDNVEIELDVAKVMRRMSDKGKKALPILANQIRTDCNKYIRVYLGHLRSSSYTASELDKGLIIWNTPYARRVYYTGTPSKDINPEASLMWGEKAKDTHMRGWERLAQKEMDK